MAHYILYCNVMHVIIARFYFLYVSTNTYIMMVIRLLLTLNSYCEQLQIHGSPVYWCVDIATLCVLWLWNVLAGPVAQAT